MITMWEIHVQTNKTLGDIMAQLKANGIASDFMLCKDGDGKLKVKHPTTNMIHMFNVKVYKELGDLIEYEFGAWSEVEFNYLKSIMNDI